MSAPKTTLWITDESVTAAFETICATFPELETMGRFHAYRFGVERGLERMLGDLGVKAKSHGLGLNANQQLEILRAKPTVQAALALSVMRPYSHAQPSLFHRGRGLA